MKSNSVNERNNVPLVTDVTLELARYCQFANVGFLKKYCRLRLPYICYQTGFFLISNESRMRRFEASYCLNNLKIELGIEVPCPVDV